MDKHSVDVMNSTLSRVACGLALTVAALTAAADAEGRPLFRTPQRAAYCEISPRNLAPENPVLACWTPNDGFTTYIAHDSTSRDLRKRYEGRNLKRTPAGGRYPLLRFGKSFRWRCRTVSRSFADGCSSARGTTVFRCTSRSTGLTCVNRKRRGFWLGRFIGYRIF